MFKAVQDYLEDTDWLVEQSRLTEQLHSAFLKSMHQRITEEDATRALGSAFKQSIDITKHGGFVDLPLSLRNHVKGKALQKYLRYT